MNPTLRRMNILGKLSKVKKNIRQLNDQLAAEGIFASDRTILRDLELLEVEGKIQSDDGKPRNWWRVKNSKDLSFDLTTAITFMMVKEHLFPLLPFTMRERLAPFYIEAERLINKESNKKQSQWSKKIYVHTKGLPLLPAEIPNDVLEPVFKALLNEHRLQITYDSFAKGETSSFVFHPLGIVTRSERSYLIGRYDAHKDIRQLLMSRISFAKELEKKSIGVKGDFSLANYVKTSELGIIRGDKKLKITLEIDFVLERFLIETPLAKDQKITKEGEKIQLTTSLDDTDELRHWLISMCNHLTVIKPASLRKEIKSILERSLAGYK